MMMAADSSPPSAALTDATLQAVRAALIGYRAAPERSDELRAALEVMAAEAREKSMLPERLLVVLKDVWNGLPELTATREGPDQARLLQRIVTMCIREYYS